MPQREASSLEGTNFNSSHMCTRVQDICSTLRGVFTCVSDGDVGGLRLQPVRISRGPVVTSAAVFIVHTLPGVQSKHGRHCQVPHRPGQEG